MHTQRLLLLPALLLALLCLFACASKDQGSEPTVQVKGQYDVSVGKTGT